jgi:TRAP-type C4-dicarboxylate transport system permease small subunit
MKDLINISGLPGFLLSIFGCVILVGMMGLTVVDVVGRYLFNAPVLGAFEITEFMVLMVVFSFLALAQSQKIHVTVDILVDRFPKQIRAIVNFINYSVCFILFTMVTWKGYEKAMEALETGDKPMNLAVPDWPFILFMTLGCAVLSIEYIRDIARIFISKKKVGKADES